MNAFKNFVLDEWYFSIPMFLMSLTAATLVVWHFLLNSNAKTRMEEFLPGVQDRLTYDGIEVALDYCKKQDGLIGRKLYTAALEASPQGTAAMKRSMATTLELDVLPSLNFLLPPILAIAKIATMVGLLGTVISMINTFNAISAAKDNPSSVTNQAGAIGLALFATAFGLMTAIPLVFMHVMFKDFISRQENQMKAAAQRLLVLFQNIKPKWDEGVRDREEDEELERKKALEEEEGRRDLDDEDRDKDDARDRKDRKGGRRDLDEVDEDVRTSRGDRFSSESKRREPMAQPQALHDLWLVAQNIVYKEVPYPNIADWIQQSRVGPNDCTKPSGIEAPWTKISESRFFSMFLSQPQTLELVLEPVAVHEPIEMDFNWKRPEEEDDDVDMIPLIDISLVLLIFFMMTATVAAISNVKIPDVLNGAKPDPEVVDSLLIEIDMKDGEPIYSLGIGKARPSAANSSLTEDRLLLSMDAQLSQMTKLATITIAAHKDLTFDQVERVMKALDKRKDSGVMIGSYNVQVGQKAAAQ